MTNIKSEIPPSSVASSGDAAKVLLIDEADSVSLSQFHELRGEPKPPAVVQLPECIAHVLLLAPAESKIIQDLGVTTAPLCGRANHMS